MALLSDAEYQRVVANAKTNTNTQVEKAIIKTHIAAANSLVGAFPVGTIVAAGMYAVAGITALVAAGRKGKAAREAAIRLWKKKGFPEAESVGRFLVRVAKWSGKKRKRKAEQLQKKIQQMEKGRVTRREQKKIKEDRLMLSILSVIEQEARKRPKERLLAEEPDSVPEVAETLPTANMDAPQDLEIGPPSWLPIAGLAFGATLFGVLILKTSANEASRG